MSDIGDSRPNTFLSRLDQPTHSSSASLVLLAFVVAFRLRQRVLENLQRLVYQRALDVQRWGDARDRLAAGLGANCAS